MAYRRPVNKSKAAHKFRKHISRTKRINLAPPVTRGGIKL